MIEALSWIVWSFMFLGLFLSIPRAAMMMQRSTGDFITTGFLHGTWWGGVVATLLWDIPKLHLLWWFPVVFIVGMFVADGVYRARMNGWIR